MFYVRICREKEKKIMGEEMVGNPLSFVNLHHFFMLNLNITH